MRIPLNQLAEIKLAQGQTVISRVQDKRQLTVKTNIRGRDQVDFAKELRTKIENQVKLPVGYTYELGGQFENLQRSEKRLMYIIPFTLLLILSILLILFDYKFRYALIVMTCIPFAVTGGILALYLRGINLSISAGVGFVSLSGVCVMTGILWISYFNLLMRKKNMPLEEAIITGSLVQFRPRFLFCSLLLLVCFPQP